MSTPFMQLYIGDYLRDTAGLTTEAHGAYLLIMFAMWNADGWVSADPRKLAMFARMTPTRWGRVAADVLPYLIIEDGMATQGRLLKQLEKASGKSLKRSVAGKLGAQAKALKSQQPPQAIATANAIANADGLLKHLPETRYQRPESKKEEPPAIAVVVPAIVSRETQLFELPPLPACLERRTPSKALVVVQSLPDWLPLESWSAYLEMRRKKRAAPTPRAIELLLNRLEKWVQAGHDPTEILDTSTRSNWTDIYEPKSGKSHAGHRPTAHDKFNAGAALFIASLGGDDGQGRQGEADGDADGPGLALLAP